MNNKPLIIGVIILILLALGGWMYMKRAPSSLTTGTGNTTQDQSAQTGTMTSLTDLLKLGKDQRCTFSSAGEYGTVDGTSYISSNKVRTDYKNTDTAGISVHGSMIMDGNYMYSWDTASGQGFKMQITESVNEVIEEAKKDPEAYQKQFDPTAQGDYRCGAWSADASKFTPPSDIQFTDYSEQLKMMENIGDQMKQVQGDPATDTNPQQCAVCDSLEGEAQTACKQAMGC